MVGCIEPCAETQLTEIIRAHDLLRFVLGVRESWQRHAGNDCDRRDDKGQGDGRSGLLRAMTDRYPARGGAPADHERRTRRIKGIDFLKQRNGCLIRVALRLRKNRRLHSLNGGAEAFADKTKGIAVRWHAVGQALEFGGIF